MVCSLGPEIFTRYQGQITARAIGGGDPAVFDGIQHAGWDSALAGTTGRGFSGIFV